MRARGCDGRSASDAAELDEASPVAIGAESPFLPEVFIK
jgi:hypothetical protein